jgi:HSP20 family protein
MASIIPVKRTPETRATELYRPFQLLEEMEELAGRMLPSWRTLPGERLFWGEALPQVDIIDREAELVVRAAVPGFGKDEIEVTSTNDAVTIRGQSRMEEREEKGEFYRREIRCEDFLRTVHLPCQVDDTKAKATYRDGVLEVVLPKVERTTRHTLKIEEK